MITINLSNVEEIIFYNTEIKNSLPKYKNFFDTWELTQRVSGLRSLKTKTLIDFLNELNPNELNFLATIESINDKLVQNIETSIEDLDLNWHGELCLYRNSDTLYITCWR